MKLFFDTETTGLVNFSLPPFHEDQPHIVSLAAVLTSDNCEHEFSSVYLIAKNDGKPSHPKAEAVNGITEVLQKQAGVPHKTILEIFSNLAKQASQVIAYNLKFDLTVLQGEVHRHGGQLFDLAKGFCEMEAMTEICKIPARYGRGKYKWPTLSKSHLHYYGVTSEEVFNAHHAMADVRATIAVHKARIAKPPVVNPV